MEKKHYSSPKVKFVKLDPRSRYLQTTSELNRMYYNGIDPMYEDQYGW